MFKQFAPHWFTVKIFSTFYNLKTKLIQKSSVSVFQTAVEDNTCSFIYNFEQRVYFTIS